MCTAEERERRTRAETKGAMIPFPSALLDMILIIRIMQEDEENVLKITQPDRHLYYQYRFPPQSAGSGRDFWVLAEVFWKES